MTTTSEAATTSRGRVRTELGHKRVRAYLGGAAVADTARPLLVWESPYYPTYYIPASDIANGVLTPDGDTVHSPSRGDAQRYTITVGARKAAGAALHYAESPIDELRGHFRLDWNAMDAWFEEDEEVFVHARSPYTRIDILPSSRPV